MKKIFIIILALCLMASVICVTAFAADNNTIQEPAADIVLRATALKRDGKTIELIGDYDNFEDGWNAAMEIAESSSTMRSKNYDRIIVDIYKDWVATDGEFTDDIRNGPGFDWDTIYFPDDSRVTLNLNGHKIDRALKTDEYDGEVIHIDEDADVIINNGTITGGWSCNGAGGIFIDNDAKVELNNVNVIGNKVTFDDGAGIGVYAGATLVMNGGSVSDNVVKVGFSLGGTFYGGGVFAESATVTLNGVTIANNINVRLVSSLKGSAVGSKDSMVTLKNCLIKDNGLIVEYRDEESDEEDTEFTDSTDSIVFAWGGTMVIENTDFIGNGTKDAWAQSESKHITALIHVDNAELTMTGGKVTDNNQVFLFYISNGAANVKGVDCTGNESLAMFRKGKYASKPTSTFTDCKFSAGIPYTPYGDEEDYQFVYDFQFGDENANITFVDCDFGEATFDNKSAAKFENTANGVGSFFGEGSLTNILVMISLIASGVSISLTLHYNKKKTVPATSNDEAKTENEE